MKRIDGLIAEFTSVADRVESTLSSMLEMVADGRVPLKSKVADLELEIETLQMKYSAIQEIAKDTVSEENLPEENCSVHVFAEAIRASEAAQLKLQLLQIEERLERFISVKSLVAAFADALEPFQTQAIALLAQAKSTDKTTDSEELMRATLPHQLFLDAVATEDFDSAEGMDLMEKLEDYYPSKIQRGLLLNKYYVPGASHDDAQPIKPETEIVVDPVNAQTEAALPVQETCADTAAPEERLDVHAAKEQESAPEDKAEPKESEGMENVLPPAMLHANNKIKLTAPNASAFKRDIQRMPKEVLTILPLFTNLGVMTSTQVFTYGFTLDCFEATDEVSDSVTRALNQLSAKGILASYDIPDQKETAYCLTNYGYGSLTKQSIISDMKSKFSLSLGKYRFAGGNEIEEKRIKDALRHTTTLLACLLRIKTICTKERFEAIIQSITWKGDHFEVIVFWDDSPYQCAVVTEDVFIDRFIGNENVLVISNQKENLTLSQNISTAAFVLEEEHLYKWNGSWQQQTKIFEKDAADDGNEEIAESRAAEKQHNNENAQVEQVPDTAEKPICEETGMPEAVSDPIAEAESSVSEEMPSISISVGTQEAAEDDGTAARLCEMILSGSSAPTDSQFEDLALRLLAENQNEYNGLLQAVLVTKAASFGSDALHIRRLYQQLALATNVGIDKIPYTGEVLTEVFSDKTAISESCMLAAYFYGMLFPHQAYDHTLRASVQNLTDEFEVIFPTYEVLKPLFHKMSTVCHVSPEGFSNSILNALSDQDKSAAHSDKLKKAAAPLLNEPKIKAHISGIPEFISACFGKTSDLNQCMQIIAENNTAERDFAVTVLSEYCDSPETGIAISEAAIEKRIDSEWKTATRGKKTYGLSLEYQARKQVFNEFSQRLDLIKSWVEYGSERATANIPEMRKMKTGIIQELRAAIDGLQSNRVGKYDLIVRWMMEQILNRLTGQDNGTILYADLLRTGIISLDDAGVPILEESMHSVKYAEPWRKVLEHIIAPKPDFQAATNAIFDNSSITFDNLHQLKMIGRVINSDSKTYVVTAAQLAEATDTANDITEHFKDSLELAYTYNRIYEVEKESLTALLDLYRDTYYEAQDFGCWRQFIKSLQQQIDEIACQRMHFLKIRLDSCKEKLKPGEHSSLLEEAQRLLEVDENFAVAEEYFNRFENGERTLTEELTAALHETDSFATFLSDDVFTPLYDECVRKTGQSLAKFGQSYVAARFPTEWTSRHKDDSKKMLSNWPSRRDNTTASQIASFFACLGFTVRGASKLSGKKQEIYQLNVESTARNMPDYLHPIAAFGTQIKSPLNVVVLYGKNMAQELVDTITSLNLGGMSVVLIDYPLDRSVRRQIAEIFHTKTSGQNSFLIIDQVLALHLAMHQDTERLPLMLKCTLPYTYYQPFVRDGGSTADEMFCGRTSELATIIDPNGACVVYGGRQLGKTALLERAESLFTKVETKSFAVYSNILKIETETAVVEKIVLDITRKTPLKLTACTSLKELCTEIDTLFRKGIVSNMLLLLDEVDSFLATISTDGYMPLQPLVDLKRESKNRFKFVLAGVHNVCRAKNATAKNGIFGQLGQPLCVKPLSPTDALQLISRPLRYLGFQVDRYPHLETILTNTNYYPGILQFFGYTLVQTMTSQYGKYYRAVDGNPPYTLHKEQLGAILNSADLNKSIKEKFRWSLELDPRYFMLARCIALLYYENNGEPMSTQRGFTVEQVNDTAKLFEIHCLENEGIVSLTNLLDEMVDMGILSRPNDIENRYRLRRKSFINIIGADVDSLLNDIIVNNEEGA